MAKASVEYTMDDIEYMIYRDRIARLLGILMTKCVECGMFEYHAKDDYMCIDCRNEKDPVVRMADIA